MFILFKTILIFIFFPKYLSILIFPFKRQINRKNLNHSNLIQNLYENILITNLTIGTPNQNYSLQIKLRRYPLSINCLEKEIEKCQIYNSLSYKSILDEEQYNNEEFTFGIESIENIIIDNKKIENIKFFVGRKIYFNNYTNGILGLNIFGGSRFTKDSNLIIQLKKKNIINSYEFFIDYINEDDGYLIIGDFPHNYYNNNIFNKENYKIIKSYIFENDKIFPKISEDLINQSFDFLINNIYFGKENIENLIKAELSFEKGLIKCSKNFGKKIKKNFFDYYLNNGICNFNNITTKYSNFISFVCDKRLEIKKFNNIKFVLDDMVTEFTLNYNDVFYIFDNKFYFLIYYKEDYGDFWELGKPFIKKYMFFFNQDKKIIGYYQINDNKFNFFPWILIVFFSIFIFFLGKYIYKLIFHNSKFKARELEELFFNNK